jgi:hypothetical protein
VLAWALFVVAWLLLAGASGWCFWCEQRQRREWGALIEQLKTDLSEVEQLMVLLQYLATQSFMYQHLPFWLAFRDATGIGFHVSVGMPDRSG